jgi:hypothetical protein
MRTGMKHLDSSGRIAIPPLVRHDEDCSINRFT